jgi:aldehyde dehydrogenase (NAD+)
VQLELGGKSPNIVFADADLSNAVNGIMAGVFAASGQTCVAGSRVLVEAGVYDQVVELLVSRARRMRPGDPFDPATQLCPLASRAQLDRVLRYFKVAREDGLELLTGGKRLGRQGFFVEPTVYGNVPNSARLAREEVFGPVAALMRFTSEEEAVGIANDTVRAGGRSLDRKRVVRIAWFRACVPAASGSTTIDSCPMRFRLADSNRAASAASWGRQRWMHTLRRRASGSTRPAADW